MRIASLVSLFALSACSLPLEGESTGQLSASLVSENKLAVNKLASNKLATNKIARNKLSANKLAGNRLAGNSLARHAIELDEAVLGDLLASADGREVLSYAIGCALPAEVDVVARRGRKTFEFKGSVGLAPEWLERPLKRTEQRWVSACLLARVNAFGVSVQISMRGAHPALAATPDEMAEFTLEEGAFWGNVFAADEAPDWNACAGADQLAGETGELVNRDCTEADPAHPGQTVCGLRFAGECGGARRERACREFDATGMHYESCSGTGRRLRAPYREVITTYVRP